MKLLPTLESPVRLGSLTLKNRLFRAPLLEGAGLVQDPAEEYARQFVPNARAGVGLIIQGTTCVTREGRPSPGMTFIDTRDNMMAMAPMTQAVHEAGSAIIIQLGHGGIHCVESWHKKFRAERRSLPLAVSAPRLHHRLMVGKVHVMDTEEVSAFARRYGTVARWAREAGYDGVEVAGANAKMMHQFLSRSYNRRDDAYGGSLWRRTAFLREVRKAIAEEAGEDYPVTLKFPAYEESWLRSGITLEEGLQIAKIAEEAGYNGLTPVSAHANPNPAFCRGDYPRASFENARMRRLMLEAMGAVRLEVLQILLRRIVEAHPYEDVWNKAIFEAVKGTVSIPVSAVGGIRTPDVANGLLGRGEADLIGVGRPFYAEPDLARKFLRPSPNYSVLCNNCNRCILPQLIGHPGACYNPETHRKQAALRAA